MATVDITPGLSSGLHPANSGTKVPYLVAVDVDFADAVTKKGSALAAADVIQVMNVPAGTVIVTAGLKVKTVLSGGATVATLDLGTGVSGNDFADGFDYFAAAAGAWSQNPSAFQTIVATADDTIDITVATLTGTLSGGVVTVWALLCDIEGDPNPGIAALGS